MNIKYFREQVLGISQTKLGIITDVSWKQISRYELTEQRPSLPTQTKLRRGLTNYVVKLKSERTIDEETMNKYLEQINEIDILQGE